MRKRIAEYLGNMRWKADYAFYLVLFLSFLISFLYLKTVVAGGFRAPFHVIKSAVADASLTMLFCLFFRGRWKWIIVPLPALVAFIVLANAMYFRYFGDMIPAQMYSSFSVFNNETFKGSLSAFRLTDIIVVVAALIPVVFAAVMGKRFNRFNAPGWMIFCDALLLVVFWCLVTRTVYKTESRWYPDRNLFQLMDVIINPHDEEWRFTYDRLNFSGYALRCLLHSGAEHHNLTAEERAYLKTYLERRGGNPAPVGRHPENLILIVVESFPAKALELDSTGYIAPYLSRLMRSDLAVYATAESLVGYGHSSDAQFVYNTGILPLKNEALALTYGVNGYPSLAKALKGHSVEIIGETGKMWNHFQTTQSYGFENLVENVAPNGMNQDSLIFREAESWLPKLRQPFYMLISTLTMHPYYDRQGVSKRLDAALLSDYNEREMEYLQRLHHFDSRLEAFIRILKKDRLYDNTLIVIVGDHPIPKEENLTRFDDTRVPLLILNSPLRDVRKSHVTQADLFPTILQLMELQYEFKGIDYRGFGTSIFEPSDARPDAEDYRLSSWLIKSHL